METVISIKESLIETSISFKLILGKKERSVIKKYLYVKDGTAYATNGVCLLKYPLNIRDGFYRAIVLKKNEVLLEMIVGLDSEYPTTDVIFKTDNYIDFLINGECDVFKYDNAYFIPFFAKETGVLLNYNLTAIAKDLNLGAVRYNNEKGTNPVIFSNFCSTTKLAIMPILG